MPGSFDASGRVRDFAVAALTGASIALASAIAFHRLANSVLRNPRDDADEAEAEHMRLAALAMSPEINRRRRPRRLRKTPTDTGSRVIRVALTGGPCGGKSSCLTYMCKRLEERQFQVFVAPEMPTFLKNSCMCGFPFVPQPSTNDIRQMLCWEGNKMQLQLDLEDALFDIAEHSGKPSVVICDRGVPDSAAYVDEDQFQSIMDERDLTLDRLMGRYSLVIHLETAAIGTKLYDALSENSQIRHETRDEAVVQDQKTQQAWASHPNVKMIRNVDCCEPNAAVPDPAQEFENKKDLAVQAVFGHLGFQSFTSHRRMFLLKEHLPSATFVREKIRTEVCMIDSTFLRDEDGGADRVVERRGRAGGGWTYSVSNKAKVIEETRISARHYTELLAQKDPVRNVVSKKRTIFLYTIPEVGRDVTHRVDEIIQQSDALTPAVRKTTSSKNLAAETAPDVANLELLTVDEQVGGNYTPPEFLKPWIDHEIVDPLEKDRYSLARLAEAC